MKNFRRTKLIREFQPWMIDACKKHIEEGHSLSSFTGKYNIAVDRWSSWVNEVKELDEIRNHYLMRLSGKKRFNIGPFK